VPRHTLPSPRGAGCDRSDIISAEYLLRKARASHTIAITRAVSASQNAQDTGNEAVYFDGSGASSTWIKAPSRLTLEQALTARLEIGIGMCRAAE